MPLISADKQVQYIGSLNDLSLKLKECATERERSKHLAFLIWNLLMRTCNSEDEVWNTIVILGILADVKETIWQFKGGPLEDQAMLKRFNESSF